MALSVILDHAQPRIQSDRIAALAGGLELNGPYYQDTFIDPVTNSLLLRPGPLYPEWYTLNTGIYAKLGPSDLTAVTPGNWSTIANYKLADVAAGPWIASTVAGPGGIVTNTTWAKNRGIYLSIFSYSAGDNFVLAEFGYNPTPSYLSSIGFRLYSGGDLEVWKNGSIVGLYNISGAILGDSKSNVLIDLLIIPCRRRELLVISRQGNGFSHVFEDIQEDDVAPVITPVSKFFINFPTASAQFQIAPIKYKTTGYASSLDYQLGEPPEGTDTLEQFDNPTFAGGASKNWRIYGDPPYAGSPTTTTKAELYKKDFSGVFVADGSAKDCRLKVTLTGDGDYTPFVYAAQVAYACVPADTDASEEVAIEDYVEELGIDVPETPTGVTMRTRLLQPDLIDSTLAAKLKRVNNRPAKLENYGLTWLDCQGDSPSWEVSTSDDTQRLTLEFRDRWKSLESYMFKDRVPLDGLNLVDALEFLLSRIGLEGDPDPAVSDWDLEAVDFTIEPIPGKEAGDFNVVIEIGDTAAEWIQRLIENYAATYHYGFRPTSEGIKFVFWSEATLDSAPFQFELWGTIPEVIALGTDPKEAYRFVYRKWEEETLPPAANDIRVTGYDPRLQRPIQTHYPDTASQDPTLAPSARPDNWWGEPLLFGLVDPAINSQDVCDRAAEFIFNRLTPVRIVVEIEAEMMVKPDGVPVWRGDDIWIHGKGRFRVISMGVDFDKEPNGDDLWQWRAATYCLEQKVASED